MSKRQAKAQASSSRATGGGFSGGFGQSTFSGGFGGTSSQLSYVTEPPDLSSISDPNLVVAFKNLTKRDSTTKAKALEEIQSYVSSNSGEIIEDSVLEAWVKLFPRTSIDNDRKVRQLSQVLNGQLCAACGKRIAKYLPKIAGAWLAGQDDGDKAISKDVQASIAQVFPTAEKQYNFLKAFQQAILDYYRNTLENETSQTLSDERNVSPDDAEAKYSRVIATSVAGIARLVVALKPNDRSKYQNDYHDLTRNEKIWQFASAKDVLIRREINRLLRACINQNLTIDWGVISTEFIYKALHSEQTGSAHELLESLILLTTRHPDVWVKDYVAKKPALQRLQYFLKQGSQSSPLSFWANLPGLFEILPNELLPANPEGASELLKALHNGITSKNEPRMRQVNGFSAFVDISKPVVRNLTSEGQRQIVSELIWPLIPRFVIPNQGTMPPTVDVTLKALNLGVMPDVLKFKWPTLTETIIGNIGKPQSEQAKDFDKVQAGISEQGGRWAWVLAQVATKSIYSPIGDILTNSLNSLVKELVGLLKAQQGKFYGVANILKAIVVNESLQKLMSKDEEICKTLKWFVGVDLPPLILSPSFEQLTLVAVTADKLLETSSWQAALDYALDAPQSQAKQKALESLIKVGSTSGVSGNLKIQQFVLQQADMALAGQANWSSIGGYLSSENALSSDTTDTILSKMVDSLSISEKSSAAIAGVKTVVERAPNRIKAFTSKPEGLKLLPNLLVLSESPDDELAHSAAAISASLQSILSGKPMTEVIHLGLREASPNSTSIETLNEFARSTLGTEWSVENVLQLLPDCEFWESSLRPFLQHAPPSALAITDVLGGSTFLLQAGPGTATATIDNSIGRDIDGYSVPLRLAIFSVNLLDHKTTPNAIFESLPIDRASRYFKLLSLTSSLANDNLGLNGANHLWSLYNHETEEDMIKFVSRTQGLLSGLIKSAVTSAPDVQKGSIAEFAANELLQNAIGRSTESFYYARAYTVIFQEIAESQHWDSRKTEEVETRLREVRKSKEVLPSIALLIGAALPLSQGKYSARVCNELVADLTAIKFASNPDAGLPLLVQLNGILQSQPGTVTTIAKQRLVFFVKHLTSWLKEGQDGLKGGVVAEIYKALIVALPIIKDMYGEHWNDILESIVAFWLQSAFSNHVPEVLPAIHASLKLYGIFRKLSVDEETNDDLIDVLKESEEAVYKGLTVLLQHLQDIADESRQPLRVVNDLLARTISKLPIRYLQDPGIFYQLLFSESMAIQQVAFDLLHQYIPAAQEKISFDAALENKVAELPEELLSLLLQTPDANQTLISSLKDTARAVPISLKGYLFSWQLVFDHFQGSTFKVQTDYVAGLKNGDYVSGLLDFASSLLGHTLGKPIDVSSFPITTYEAYDDATPLKAVHMHLTHLYFLTLKHLPALAKAWWIDCKSRQTTISIESWTEKYISPDVINDALKSVSEWAANPATSGNDEEEQLIVKVAPRVREIIASYEVDEQHMSIMIRLPPTYPLHNATVEGINRVAISEKKWQTWLVITQGVITFSNNNLVDGLVAWRKNVVGALKGHSECAICYSLVSADKQLPSKRCQTCKNLFHGSCLFKWFKSSNGSTCPLCRTQFNYA